MDCTQTSWLSDIEYFHHFKKKVVQQRVPISGSLDLTRRCNLRCVHCYQGGSSKNPKDHRELSTNEWLSHLDDITEAGCLYLLITGGDPLLRKDFSTLYRHAKRNGLLVTVFTNGTLISDDIAGLFTDLPPQLVEISLYGATAGTYEGITGVQGSYTQCLSGIRKLVDHGINLKIKTILMILNAHEFYDMERMAKEYGVKFRFDAAIFPCFNGDKTPLRLRVAPEEAVEKEFSDAERSQNWREYYEKRKDLVFSDSLYLCGAGLTNFHIDPFGNLQPCLMTQSYKYDLSAGGFLNGWRNLIPSIRAKKAGAAYSCNGCGKRSLCGFCPPYADLEHGEEKSCSGYLCKIGELRYQAINNRTLRGGIDGINAGKEEARV
jgi:MoaA/NifB/PqqE/SkfB family radical SAM enzyme